MILKDLYCIFAENPRVLLQGENYNLKVDRIDRLANCSDDDKKCYEYCEVVGIRKPTEEEKKKYYNIEMVINIYDCEF